MTTKPFLIDAVLGNSRMLITLTQNSEIQRLFWPHVDGVQHVARILGGLSVDGGPVTWQDSEQWQHAQAYEQDQNVLVTRSRLASGLALTTTDTAVPGRDLFVRQLCFTNHSGAAASVRYVLYQWIRMDEHPLYNTALFDEDGDCLLHYRKDCFMAVGADRTLADVAVGRPDGVFADAMAARFGGGTILHGDVAGAALWDLGQLAPGESVSLSLFWAMGGDRQAVVQLLGYARSTGANELLAEARTYWMDWLSQARPLRLPLDGEPAEREPAEREPAEREQAEREQAEREPALAGLPTAPAPPEQVQALYRRSLLVFKLMSDEQTGAVIAAPEFDPTYAASGGYAYCWGRDAAYITTAMDLAGYHALARQFYEWALRVQEPGGWWMHRHYATGRWAPSWGLIQVDETGSILYGMALHARVHGGDAFARQVWPSVARAADWLVGNMDPDTGLPAAAVDLWEERTAQLTYSSGAVFAGLTAAAELAQRVGEQAAAARYTAAAEVLRQAILRETVRDGRFLRSRHLHVAQDAYDAAVAEGRTARVLSGAKGHPVWQVSEDPVPDSSLLGMSTPFRVVAHDHPVMAATVRRLVDSLWSAPAGGMRRYTGDHYRGGNPWILCTLWLGLYEAERGERDFARQMLDWAVARQTGTGLLAEQVDAETGAPVWVVPLTWSHAMYVLLALELYGEQ